MIRTARLRWARLTVYLTAVRLFRRHRTEPYTRTRSGATS